MCLSCLLTWKEWFRCWTSQKPAPEFHCPLWRYWGWRLTCQMKSFPQTAVRKTTEDVTQTDQFMNWNHHLNLLEKINLTSTKALTSVKCISFLPPVLCGRNSSCSAKVSSPSNLQREKKMVRMETWKKQAQREAQTKKNWSFHICWINLRIIDVWSNVLAPWVEHLCCDTVLPIIPAVSVHLLKLHSGLLQLWLERLFKDLLLLDWKKPSSNFYLAGSKDNGIV